MIINMLLLQLLDTCIQQIIREVYLILMMAERLGQNHYILMIILGLLIWFSTQIILKFSMLLSGKEVGMLGTLLVVVKILLFTRQQMVERPGKKLQQKIRDFRLEVVLEELV